jgi:signal peptidase II
MSDTPPSPSPVSTPVATRPEPMLTRMVRYRLLLGLALVVYVLDQLTKWMVIARLPYGTYFEGDGAIPVIRGFFNIVHVGNTGAAWSMFSGKSVVLALLAAGTLLAIFYWRRALGLHDRIAQVAFGLLCGGIVGNLTDRIVHHHVIDFIDLHFGTYVYPTFNVADCGICVGVILYIWQSLRAPKSVATRPSDS